MINKEEFYKLIFYFVAAVTANLIRFIRTEKKNFPLFLWGKCFSVLHLLFSWYVLLVLIITFANYWEFCQKKDFGAKYSISDILLTTLGGVLAILLI